MSSSADDLELTQYLRGDSALSRAYRDMAHAQPPMHLDSAVLRAARGAVGAPRRGRLAWWQPSSRRWTVPAALASVLLVASVSMLVVEDEDATDITAPQGASRNYIEPLPAGDAGASGNTGKALAPSAEPSPSATRADDDRPDAAGSTASSGAALRAPREASGTLEEDTASSAPPAAASAPAPPSAPSAPAVAPQRIAPQSGPEVPAADLRERELAAIRAQVEASDQREAQAARRALLQAEEQRAAFEARRARVAEERQRLEALVGADAAADAQGDARATEQEALFERVRDLLADGRVEQARTLVEELLTTGAGIQVPPDIRQALGLPQ